MSEGQLTGMRGVYLVAAELSRLGFIASPTSRGAMGADILVTDPQCTRSFSVQVKSNAVNFGFFLVGKRATEIVSPTHIYALVNLHSKDGVEAPEFFVVPSEVLAGKVVHDKAKKSRRGDQEPSEWWAVRVKDVAEYKDKWDVFGVLPIRPVRRSKVTAPRSSA